MADTERIEKLEIKINDINGTIARFNVIYNDQENRIRELERKVEKIQAESPKA